MKIVVVESPAKAKTINKYLGRDYEVLASFGHVRDLPAKDGSVDPEHDFRMIWEVDDKSQKRLNDIAKAVKGADKLREDGFTGDVKILTSCPSCLQGLSLYNDDSGTTADYIVVEIARHLLGENWMPEYVARANNGGIERVLV